MKRVLVLAPHSDDEVLGCGGSLYWHSQFEDKVTVAILSDSVSAQYAGDDSMLEVRRDACRQAAKVLGVERVEFYDLPDAKLNGCIYDVIRTINEALSLDSFDWVYAPDKSEINTDHRAVYEALQIATRPNRCNIERLCLYETSIQKVAPFQPNNYRALSLKHKLEAFRCYTSENRTFPDPISCEAVKVLAKYRGVESNMRAAEAFIIRDFCRRNR